MAQVQKDSSAWSVINASVWDIVNPISNLGAQFFGGPFSYPTYWRMVTKGVANVDPFFISRFLSFIPKYAYNNAINPGLKAMGWDQGVNGFFKKVGGFFDRFKIANVKFDKEYGFVFNPNNKVFTEEKVKGVLERIEKKYKNVITEKNTKRKLHVKKKLEKITNKVSSKFILGAGVRMLGYIGLAYTTYDIIKTVGEGLNFLHEMSVNLAQDIEAKRQHMLKVDFNKPLYGGYLTAGAYTERQRAIRLLARNPGLPQPFIGNEADRYMRRF